jgi:tyrosine-protein phosphatase MSG5
MMDEPQSDPDEDRNSVEVAKEARALDKEMADRILARKSSASSVASSGFMVGSAWKSRYNGRKRAGSVASNLTSGSLLSEDLVEEDEEEQLLGVGGGFDQESNATSPESQCDDDISTRLPLTPQAAQQPLRIPPSTSASMSMFPRVPPTPVQASFDSAPRIRTHSKNRHRPVPLFTLPPVPASPIAPPVPSVRVRTESRKPDRPPPYLRSTRLLSQPLPPPTPTLFVFPPSPTLSKQAPSTMILTPTVGSFVPFPSLPTSSAPNRKSSSRRMSLIGVAPPVTPTTAYSRVDARGWIGLD